MLTKSRPSFAFLVLAFNHQDYILEHLESIKYLVSTYGNTIDVDLIISDDCSKDKTLIKIELWVKFNADLFRSVKIINNPKNLGTCASVNNMINHLFADACKLTAGDDVYSHENIFHFAFQDVDLAFSSGVALYISDSEIQTSKNPSKLAAATQEIYKNRTSLHRFSHISYTNAPNLIYSTKCLLNQNVRDYLSQFDVVEDWPLQIAISREYPKSKFKLINHVLVYYRRTSGSTYIVENERFRSDKIRIFHNLINDEKGIFQKLRIRNRKFCFNVESVLMGKLLNIDLYFFAISWLTRFWKIQKLYSSMDINLRQHKEHYAKIQYEVAEVEKKIFE